MGRGDAADDRITFLETGKAAHAIGATDEFRKMEGVNVKRNAEPGDYLYAAMSEINDSMSDDSGEIQLGQNDAGVVYRMELERDFDGSRMEPALVGGTESSVCGGCPMDARPDSASEVCKDCAYNPTKAEEEGFVGTGMQTIKTALSGGTDIENFVTNPDNIVIMEDDRVIVGEDSDLHENNMIWVFDPT